MIESLSPERRRTAARDLLLDQFLTQDNEIRNTLTAHHAVIRFRPGEEPNTESRTLARVADESLDDESDDLVEELHARVDKGYARWAKDRDRLPG